MTLLDIIIAALLATLFVFVVAHLLDKVEEWRYRRRRAAEEERDESR